MKCKTLKSCDSFSLPRSASLSLGMQLFRGHLTSSEDTLTVFLIEDPPKRRTIFAEKLVAEPFSLAVICFLVWASELQSFREPLISLSCKLKCVDLTPLEPQDLRNILAAPESFVLWTFGVLGISRLSRYKDYKAIIINHYHKIS